MARKIKSPTGIALNDLVNGLTKQGLKIPDEVQKLLDEEEAAKVEKKAAPKPKRAAKPAAEKAEEVKADQEQKQQPQADPNPAPKPNPAPAPANNVKPKKKPFNLRNVLLTQILGKDIAKKIEKSFPNQQEKVAGPDKAPSDPSQPRRKSSYASDIKDIKADVEEIKVALKLGTTRPTPITPAKPSKLKSSFLKSLLGNKLGKITDQITSRSTRVDKPVVEKKATRVPFQDAPQTAADQLKKETQSGTTVEENKDQSAAEVTKDEVSASEDKKKTQSKLDKIITMLEKIKAGGGKGGLGLGSMLTGILSAISGLKGVIGSIWGGIKKLGSMLKTAVGTIFRWFKSIGGGLARLLSKAGLAVEGLLGRSLLGAGAAAGAAVAVTAGGLYLMDKGIEGMHNDSMAKMKQLERWGLKNTGEVGGYYMLDGKRTQYEDLPDSYKKLVSAYTGDGRDKDARDARDYINKNPDEFKKLEVKQSALKEKDEGDDFKNLLSDSSEGVPAPADNKAQAISKPNISRLPQASADNVDMKRDASTPVAPTVIVKQGDKNIIAPSQKGGSKTIVRTRNSEPSLDRLNASIFDHPAGYFAPYRM